MPYDPDRHHRRSIRLRGYDYARPGFYFVTICAQGRQRLFGAISGGTMHLNDAGRLVARWWEALNHKFPVVTTDAFVVMPDHIHGIIVIRGAGDVADAGNAGAAPAVSLPAIMQWFKIMTTTEYIRSVKQSGWPPFERRVWQRGYHEHIVRNDESLARIRHDIAANPARWPEARDDTGVLPARMKRRT